MRHPRLMLLLMNILIIGLLTHGTSVQASVPEDPTNIITLEKTVEFEDTQGGEVLVAPGTYTVAAGKETLELTLSDSSTAITIEADENSHQADIPTPTAASIPGQEGPLANTHVVILFLPDGNAFQAIGTYPGIQSRGIPAESEETGNTTTISFEKSVHFIAPDGSPVVAEPGSYTAEVAQDWIRLIPDGQRHNALLIEAQKGTNDTEVEELVALSLPGATAKELDLHHVMLLLPNGQTLEATGSYSGIQARGWFKKAFKKAKKRVNRAYKKTRRTVSKVRKGVGRTAKKIGKGASRAALKAKRAAEHAARVAAAKAKAIAQKAAKFAKIQACKVMVAGLKAGTKIPPFMQKGLAGLKKGFSSVSKKFKTDKGFKGRIDKTIERAYKQHQRILPEIKRISDFFKNPRNKKTIDRLFSANNICGGSSASMDQQLRKLGLIPNFALVRSRGEEKKHFYMSYQLGGSAVYVGGIQPMFVFATDYKGQHRWFFSLGLAAGLDLGVAGAIMFHPKANLETFDGRSWGAGAAYFVGLGVSLNPDFSFDGIGIQGGVKGGGSISHSWSWGL